MKLFQRLLTPHGAQFRVAGSVAHDTNKSFIARRCHPIPQRAMHFAPCEPFETAHDVLAALVAATQKCDCRLPASACATSSLNFPTLQRTAQSTPSWGSCGTRPAKSAANQAASEFRNERECVQPFSQKKKK